MDVAFISGINNISIFDYFGKRLFFFGDMHVKNANSCEEDGNCDYLSYKFDKVMTYDSECTAIGPLLKMWFDYNFYNKIPTDLLIEESITLKSEPRSYYKDYDTTIKKRKNYHAFKTIFPEENISWLTVVTYIFRECLLPNATGCYYPYGKCTAVDIRALEGEQVNPFDLKFIEYDSFDVVEINDLKDELLLIIYTLINNYENIFVYTFEGRLDQLDQLFTDLIGRLKVLKRVYRKQYKLIKKLADLNLIGAALASLDPYIALDIKRFILDDVDGYLTDVILAFEANITKLFKNFDKKSTKSKKLSINVFMTEYIEHFTVLAARMMDAYVLAKIHLSKGEDVIVYTGAYHIEVYNRYFRRFVEPLVEVPTSKTQKCIYIPNLKDYLDVNAFRQLL